MTGCAAISRREPYVIVVTGKRGFQVGIDPGLVAVGAQGPGLAYDLGFGCRVPELRAFLGGKFDRQIQALTAQDLSSCKTTFTSGS